MSAGVVPVRSYRLLDMGVDHGRFEMPMTGQRLDGADIAPRGDEMRAKEWRRLWTLACFLIPVWRTASRNAH